MSLIFNTLTLNSSSITLAITFCFLIYDQFRINRFLHSKFITEQLECSQLNLHFLNEFGVNGIKLRTLSIKVNNNQPFYQRSNPIYNRARINYETHTNLTESKHISCPTYTPNSCNFDLFNCASRYHRFFHT